MSARSWRRPDRLGKLIDDVLDLTQSEAGGGPMRTQKVDLRALCQQAGSAFAAAAAEAKIELVLHIEDGVGTVDGEPRRLREALHHLLRNAISHTPAGGRVLLHGDGDRGEAMLTGERQRQRHSPGRAGASVRSLPSHAERRRRDFGGLGLPLTRQFVEAHGGSVSLLSEPGEGTSVTIRLPRGR
jgi:signal transduction histidine kinase